ncbi:hypothetical protein ABPG73_016956 [Tetrahymena malaccensis]
MQSQEQIAKQNEQTQNQKGTTMTTMAKIGAQSYLSLNLLQGNQSSRMPTIQQLQKQQISQTNSQLINPKLDQNYENEKESQSQQQQEEIAIQNKHNQDDKNQNEILHKQNLQNEQIEDNKQESQLISQTAFIKNLEILKAKPLLLRIIIFHEFFNIFYSYNPTISRAIRFNIFYLRIVHSLCLTTIFDESYNIQQKIMISIASSIILVTGVTIITNIHKIKAVGRKLSAFFMICLLLFYYYVILTIISGEDVYQANTKTLSFLMIAAIDFLGIITLLSILKLAIAFNSLKSTISQELIVGNLQNQFSTTGQSFHKNWSNNQWNNNLDFAIYGWFKISSQQPISDWIVGFHFTQNDSTWNNQINLGDRVLSFFIKASLIQGPLDISFISSAVPSLSQTYNQFSKSVIQINLKKYQIPFHSNLDIQQDMMQKQNISNKDNIQMRFESHFSQSPFMIPSLIQKNLPNQYQQQNKNVFQQNAENDIEIVELDQLEQKQENQQKQNESNKPRQSIQISKQNEEIQQLDSLNNEMSEANLQNQNKQQTNQSLEPSIVKLEQYQTSLVNNLDNFNHKNQQKDEQQIERLDQQSNCGISIGQDQNINRKNSNIQQSSLCQRKPEEEEQKLKEQYIIDQNLQRLFQKSFAIKIILFHDFFNIFYTFDNKMSRGIRFNIFYLRTIHSLCLTTIFDDSYTIQQKILISIFSSLILVTGVKIITLIHKIKIVGQKISLIILLSLLIFYYYVILSIISGEEASYANSKTISFVLILGIDFLGVLTLISILKLSLIYLSEKYQYSISQELIVGNLQNQQTTTGQSFHKDWSNSDWNNNLDFAIYGWYKLSSQQATADWIVGFHFTQNDNTTWSNGEKLGDRVLSFFIKGNYVETPTYTTYQNYQFIVQICDQDGASAAQGPLDISFISKTVPSLSQTYNQFSKSIIQINLKKYQIPFNSNLDIQVR